MTDFNALLSAPIGSIEKPKPIPTGGYIWTIGQPKFDKSPEKKTDYVRFPLICTEPLGDVDADALQEALAGKAISEIEKKIDLYITKDALWRLQEFLQNAGVEEGLPLEEGIQAAVGRQIVGVVSHEVSKKDPSQVYANVEQTAKVPEE